MSNLLMKPYHQMLERVLREGVRKSNRTGVDTLAVFGHMMQFDLQLGFPAITTKKLAFDAVKGELLGFIRGFDSAAQFRELGCKIWDQNANENEAWLKNPNREGEDDLGRIYGVQWRNWSGLGNDVDQLANVVKTILLNPQDRRMIISAWRPDELDHMALPPCHVLYHFNIDAHGRIDLAMYQRSADSFLGVPFNIASASLLLHIVARLTGRMPGKFVHMLGDVHIYVNHLSQVQEQLSRFHYNSPRLEISEEVESIHHLREHANLDEIIKCALDTIEPHHITLQGYQHHDAIKAPMAV